MRNRMLALGGMVALLGAAACTPDDEEGLAYGDADTAAVAAAAPMAMDMDAAIIPLGDLTTDAQVMNFIAAANAYEIEHTDAALTRLTEGPVRDYAQMLQQEHANLRQRLGEVQQATGLMPPENYGATPELLAAHRQAMDALMAMPVGADYDRAWLQHQVQMHELMLRGLQAGMTNTALNEQVRELVNTAQARVQEHLTTARSLLNTPA